MTMTRREVAAGAMALAAMSATQAKAAPAPGGGEKIAMILYPGMTALDLVGPHYALASMPGANVQLAAAKPGKIVCDRGMSLFAESSLADVPADLDMLFLPGGAPGTIAAMQDPAFLAFLADRGKRARFVTSVCTGSLVLAAAGLLKGYQATCHWAFRDILPMLGATPVAQRVVTDRNRITAGGVTAGIDFGLRLVAQFRGERSARAIQLTGEYDPDPPFAGSPDKALPEAVADVRAFTAKMVKDARAAARSVRVA
ncbi:hypothetical protein ASE00_16695 [Sphingomonas sp. Root710]|uniref:DJ-1/PfpI family protein n=1 Tax=Sphingomonas sp. Root710 TaxID=1736594 RepID=UPI0006FE0D68|nr:DJ-1/PfpI family protein [Sphingomonas sp. Root710]KRB80674.1 hypothetical protein ASE00_16695 [Sphingomonas sp. Root710]